MHSMLEGSLHPKSGLACMGWTISSLAPLIWLRSIVTGNTSNTFDPIPGTQFPLSHHFLDIKLLGLSSQSEGCANSLLKLMSVDLRWVSCQSSPPPPKKALLFDFFGIADCRGTKINCFSIATSHSKKWYHTDICIHSNILHSRAAKPVPHKNFK